MNHVNPEQPFKEHHDNNYNRTGSWESPRLSWESWLSQFWALMQMQKRSGLFFSRRQHKLFVGGTVESTMAPRRLWYSENNRLRTDPWWMAGGQTGQTFSGGLYSSFTFLIYRFKGNNNGNIFVYMIHNSLPVSNKLLSLAQRPVLFTAEIKLEPVKCQHWLKTTAYFPHFLQPE